MEARRSGLSDPSDTFEWGGIEEDITVSATPLVVPFELGPTAKAPKMAIPPAQSQVIAIASGKGGTGKTTFTTNLAIALRQKGLRVLILDADFGLANDHLLLGLKPKGDVGDVLGGRKDLREILLEGPEGIQLLPGGVGSTDLSNLEGYQLQSLAREIGTLEPDFDVILVDLAAGVSSQIMRFLKPAHEVVLVTNPEITALIDAYGLIKCLSAWNPKASLKVQVVFNRVRDREEATASMQRLRHTVSKHLSSIRLNYLGHIPFDRYLLHSIAIQDPVLVSHPRSNVVACLRAVADRIFDHHRAWDKNQQHQKPLPSYFAKLEQQSYE